jgi:protein subunit release factor A
MRNKDNSAFAFDEGDIRVEIMLPLASDPNFIGYNALNAPIRVTHLPTGKSAIGEGCGNQIANKQMAIDLLKDLLSESK